MLRLWLPQRHLLLQHLHSNESSSSLRRRAAASFIFLHHFRTSTFCLDRRPRLSASSTSEDSISTLQKKSKGQKKREAYRSVDWAAEFATFSDSQLRRAIRWGDLKEEIYDAVRIVKKIGRDGRHARTRQLKLIGGMLRAVDPELMEAIIKAIKDGNVEGVFNKPDDPNDEDEDEDEEDEDDDEEIGEIDDDGQESPSSEEDLDNQEHNEDTVDRWFQGLLSGDSDVVAEVYSIRSADFNRQELRRLVRDVSKSQNKTAEKNTEANFQAGISTKSLDPQAKLKEYLESLIVKSRDD